jgi:hypothetical protein
LALYAEQLRINGCSVRWITDLSLGLFAEQATMDVPKDLGRRIVEASGLAVALHLQLSLCPKPNPGGAGQFFGPALFPIGGADRRGGGAVTDGGDSFAPRPAITPCAGSLAESEAA